MIPHSSPAWIAVTFGALAEQGRVDRLCPPEGRRIGVWFPPRVPFPVMNVGAGQPSCRSNRVRGGDELRGHRAALAGGDRNRPASPVVTTARLVGGRTSPGMSGLMVITPWGRQTRRSRRRSCRSGRSSRSGASKPSSATRTKTPGSRIGTHRR